MMSGIGLHQLADYISNDYSIAIYGENTEISSLCIDSREVSEGALFVALQGNRVDGHDYIQEAQRRGAVGAIVEHRQNTSLAQIVVADSASAMAKVARFNRDQFNGKVVAITGSAGKTTCKNMLASVLAQSHSVCATQGNFNNELGVPLTLQRLTETHDFAVIEMGAAAAGDIAFLAEIALPHISVVTNVSEAHLGRFGSLDITASTKGEIYTGLAEGGTAIVNLDDQYAVSWVDSIANMEKNIRIIGYSLRDMSANVVATDIRTDADGLHFNVQIALAEMHKSVTVKLPLLGRHNIANALAVIAISEALSISDTDIQRGLLQVSPECGRLNLVAAKNDLMLIDDSYNANPEAMIAAIDVLAELGRANNKNTVLVLGDMGELGDGAGDRHFDIGKRAAHAGVDHLLAVGEFAKNYVEGFCAHTNGSSWASRVDSKEQIGELLLSAAFAGAAVLIKGSRFTQMEHVVELLSAEGLALC